MAANGARKSTAALPILPLYLDADIAAYSTRAFNIFLKTRSSRPEHLQRSLFRKRQEAYYHQAQEDSSEADNSGQLDGKRDHWYVVLTSPKAHRTPQDERWELASAAGVKATNVVARRKAHSPPSCRYVQEVGHRIDNPLITASQPAR